MIGKMFVNMFGASPAATAAPSPASGEGGAVVPVIPQNAAAELSSVIASSSLRNEAISSPASHMPPIYNPDEPVQSHQESVPIEKIATSPSTNAQDPRNDEYSAVLSQLSQTPPAVVASDTSPVIPSAVEESSTNSPATNEVVAPPFDPAHKDMVGAQLANRMLDAIDKKELTEGEMSVISGYILDTIATVNNEAQLIAFLKELSWRWPIFKQILKIEQGIDAEKGDDQKAAEIEDLIKENKLDDAIQAAHSAVGGGN